jgi:signal transduction histidine kinase
MSTASSGPEPQRGATWGEPETRDAIRQIADALRRRAGFKVCAVEVVKPDRQLEFVAIVGSPDGEAELLGRASPLEAMLPTFSIGATYGTFHFVAEEWMTPELIEQMNTYGWVPDIPPVDDPLAWRAQDMLLSRVFDDRGDLRGLVYFDEPLSGRRPTHDELVALNLDSQLLLRAVLTQIEREELAQQVRITQSARDLLLAAASTHLSLPELLEETYEALVEGLRAESLAGYVSGEPRPAAAPSAVHLPPDLHHAAMAATSRAWARRAVIIVEADGIWEDDELERSHGEEFHAHLKEFDDASLALVPLGVGSEPLGMLIVARPVDGVRWTDPEIESLRELGRDLGRVILNHRSFEREQLLRSELERLDDYRVELLSTISHELKNPISVLLGHLEVLEGEELDPTVRHSLEAMERAANRLDSLAENLLMLRQSSDRTPLEEVPVDMGQLVADAIDLSAMAAQREGVRLTFLPETAAVVVPGDPVQLDRVVVNLVNNAVKYTPRGGSVTVSLGLEGGWALFTVADTGLGISAEDQPRLFSEFFRSTNAQARAKPGTGLGLAIVKRTVERHGGRVEFDSELGVGTTFRVYLPAS